MSLKPKKFSELKFEQAEIRKDCWNMQEQMLIRCFHRQK